MTFGGPRSAAAVAACVLLLLGTRAAADPGPTAEPVETETLHVTGGGTLDTLGGSHLILPPGYYVPEPEWKTLDAEVRRLQDQETRLTAERDEAMRIARSSGDGFPGWLVATVAGLFGAVAGALWQHAR